jgi:hypothetical protein
LVAFLAVLLAATGGPDERVGEHLQAASRIRLDLQGRVATRRASLPCQESEYHVRWVTDAR